MDNETRRNLMWLWLAVIGLCVSNLIHLGCDKEEQDSTIQATVSDKDIKAMVNTMWNEREANRKNKLKIEEAVKRSLKGEIGQLPGVK